MNTVNTKNVFGKYPDVVDVPQLQEMLGGIGRKAVYKLINDGEIKAFRIGKGYKIPKYNVLVYLGLIEGAEQCI